MKRRRREDARTRGDTSVEVVIETMAHGGDGVAFFTHEGARRTVFVGRTVVGDVARARVDFSTRPARGRLEALLAPSSDRVTPPCEWAERCGGCDWMHVSRDAQPRLHEAIVRSLLPERYASTPIVAHAAPAVERYRTRARVHLESRGGRVHAGMRAARSHEVVDVSRCLVLASELEPTLEVLRDVCDGATGRGEASLALGVDRLPVFDLRWDRPLPPSTYRALEEAVSSRRIAGARVRTGDSGAAAPIGDATPWMRGADGAPLKLAPGGFGQASEQENAHLATRILAACHSVAPPTSPATKATELFAGAGNLSVLLARDYDLTTVEHDELACAAARENLARRELRARVSAGDANQWKPPAHARLVVLDPPRGGARELCQRIVDGGVHGVVYVSCDPATLGRDLTTFGDRGYELLSVETFEMFPQTSHVETVCALWRRRGGA